MTSTNCPTLSFSASSRTMSKQLALVVDSRSAEPCHSTGVTTHVVLHTKDEGAIFTAFSLDEYFYFKGRLENSPVEVVNPIIFCMAG